MCFVTFVKQTFDSMYVPRAAKQIMYRLRSTYHIKAKVVCINKLHSFATMYNTSTHKPPGNWFRVYHQVHSSNVGITIRKCSICTIQLLNS